MAKEGNILFELLDRGNTYVLSDKNGNPIKAPRTYIVPKKGRAYNPKTGRDMLIKYHDGASSIWADEQVKNGDLELFPKDEHGNPIIPFTQRRLSFKEGLLLVPRKDLIKIEFLRALPGNQVNGGKIFKERDFVKEARVAAKHKLSIATGITAVMNLDEDRLLYAHTAYFPGEKVSSLEIMRVKLIDVAEVYAEDGELDVFVDSLLSNETFEKYRTSKMFDYDILKLADNGRVVKWASGGILLQVPINEDYVDITTHFFLNHENGRVAHKTAISRYDAKVNDLDSMSADINKMNNEIHEYSKWTGKDVEVELKNLKLLRKHGPKAYAIGMGEAAQVYSISTNKDLVIALNDPTSDVRRRALELIKQFKED